jgi:hypothetical protein
MSMAIALAARVLAGMSVEHRFHDCLQGVRVCRHDLPKDGVVEAEVLMTNAIADALDLRPRLRRVVRQPRIRQT